MTIDVAKAAGLLVEVRASGIRLDSLPDDCRPTSLSEAYAIQQAVQQTLATATDGSIAGYKVGAAGEAAMTGFGLEEPFAGTLLDSFMFTSPASITRDSCFIRVIELEFAFRISEDFAAAAAPYDLDAVLAGVDQLAVSIEVVDSRYLDLAGAGGLQVIADSGGAGVWIEGPATADFHDLDFEDYPATLRVNGKAVATGNSANVYGNPLHSLAWLINNICARGGTVGAGNMVTTGTFQPPTPVDVGDFVSGDFGALGTVEVQF